MAKVIFNSVAEFREAIEISNDGLVVRSNRRSVEVSLSLSVEGSDKDVSDWLQSRGIWGMNPEQFWMICGL